MENRILDLEATLITAKRQYLWKFEESKKIVLHIGSAILNFSNIQNFLIHVRNE